MVSSWKLLISAAGTVFPVICAASDAYGMPMFPATFTSAKWLFKISPVNAVVVVFPFVPVMAARCPFAYRYASSISPQMRTPCSRSFCAAPVSDGMPGDKTAIETCSITASASSPSTTVTSVPGPLAASCPKGCASFARISASHAFSFPSYTIMSAPSASSSRAAAMPLAPVPATRIFFPPASWLITLFIFIPPVTLTGPYMQSGTEAS